MGLRLRGVSSVCPSVVSMFGAEPLVPPSKSESVPHEPVDYPSAVGP